MTPNKTTRITSISNQEDIENLLGVAASPDCDAFEIEPSLPLDGNLGVESQILQVLGTWFRSREDSFPVTILKTPGRNSLEKVTERLLGVCALALASEIKLEGTSQPIPKREALSFATNSISNIRAQNYTAAFTAEYAGVPSLQAPGYGREFEQPFYKRQLDTDGLPLVASPEAFSNFIRTNAQFQTPESDWAELWTKRLAIILRELFSNTHKHARTGIQGNPLTRNFRCVSISKVSVTKDMALRWSQGDIRAAHYIGTFLKTLERSAIPMLAISVTDSGIGYAQRWTSKSKESLSLREEEDALLACFAKYGTTASRSSAGGGLTNVLRGLKTASGWMRVRSGRLRLTKAFTTDEVRAKVEHSDLRPMKYFAHGVSFTALIPLILKDN